MSAATQQPGKPVRILFQFLTKSTRAKAQGTAINTPSTGGGARDLRISPHEQIQPFMERMFSRIETRTRPASEEDLDSGEEDASQSIDILVGTATWGNGRDRIDLEYWPPTKARPKEGRISRINSLPPLQASGSQDLVLFVQDDNDLIWVRCATIAGLNGSARDIRDFILGCQQSTQGSRIASGYIDLMPDGLGAWCTCEVAREFVPGLMATRLLSVLKQRKNVLLTGPPGTGKTRLLSEMARWFKEVPQGIGFDPQGGVPFPVADPPDWLIDPSVANRESFLMTFHPGTRYRHLLRGLEPDPLNAGQFRYSEGLLFDANEHARQIDHASLLAIDELNRGPAVEAFGEALVAIEADKRADANHQPRVSSYPIQLPGDDGRVRPYYLADRLYILAAMNEADASIAPIDVAFRRRWYQFDLQPDEEIARRTLGTSGNPSIEGLLKELLAAWMAVNNRIALLRGSEYRIGHALVMPEPERDIRIASEAVLFVQDRWRQLESSRRRGVLR